MDSGRDVLQCESGRDPAATTVVRSVYRSEDKHSPACVSSRACCTQELKCTPAVTHTAASSPHYYSQVCHTFFNQYLFYVSIASPSIIISMRFVELFAIKYKYRQQSSIFLLGRERRRTVSRVCQNKINRLKTDVILMTGIRVTEYDNCVSAVKKTTTDD